MTTPTARAGLPKPIGSEYPTRVNYNLDLDAIDAAFALLAHTHSAAGEVAVPSAGIAAAAITSAKFAASLGFLYVGGVAPAGADLVTNRTIWVDTATTGIPIKFCTNSVGPVWTIIAFVQRPFIWLARNTALTVPTVTTVVVPWQVEVEDAWNAHAGSSTDISLPFAGLWHLSARTQWGNAGGSTGGVLSFSLQVGATVVDTAEVEISGNPLGFNQSLSLPMRCAAGDVVTATIAHSLNVSTTVVGAATNFTAVWLGS